MCHPGMSICVGAGAHTSLLVHWVFEFRQTNILLHAGQVIYLFIVLLYCRSAPHFGQALMEGVLIPPKLMLGHFCFHAYTATSCINVYNILIYKTCKHTIHSHDHKFKLHLDYILFFPRANRIMKSKPNVGYLHGYLQTKHAPYLFGQHTDNTNLIINIDKGYL